MNGLPVALAEALVVQLLLVLCYVFPPMFALRLWRTGDSRCWLDGIVAALCVQSVLGFLWNVFTPAPMGIEALLYVMVWIGVAVWRGAHTPSSPVPVSTDRLLWLLVTLAVVVRLIHPLQTFALGQSDAYSHWQFIFDVLERGRLRHVVYPSGYHWVLALPVWIGGIDPYLMARFGGAFAAALLVMAVYALGDALGGRRTARIVAWFVAVCPLAWWLLKTGIGVFPNQFGLLLLPCIWLAYLRWLERPSALTGTSLLLLLAGLATSAPLFLLDVAILLAVHQCAVWARADAAVRRRSARCAVWVFVAAVVPVALMLAVAGLRPVLNSLSAIAGGLSFDLPPDDPRQIPYLLNALVRDFFLPKRAVFQLSAVSAMSGVLAIGFTALAVAGWRRRRMDWLLVGAWGLLAALQTGWGILQFTRYQRAGWQLFLALAVGGALAVTLPLWTNHRIFRLAVRTAIVALTVVCFMVPPGHRPMHSAAESELVDFMRAFSRQVLRTRDLPVPRVLYEPRLPESLHLGGHRRLFLLSRRYTGFSRGQGDPVYAALGLRQGIKIRPLGRGEWSEPDDECPVLIVLDRPAVHAVEQLGLTARLNAALAEASLSGTVPVDAAHREAEEFLGRLDPAAWRITRVSIAPALEAILAEPIPRDP
ncbi:MAG TPA: hypothetical protein PKE12_14515 [Kiritimatiellia bacterium]|nr:hypothetical protein [Kiritimatiellia bacterium]